MAIGYRRLSCWLVAMPLLAAAAMPTPYTVPPYGYGTWLCCRAGLPTYLIFGIWLSYLPLRMRIATWNLERVRPGAGVRSQRIRDAIAGIDPDVWVLTESHADFVPAPGYVRHAVSAEAPDRGGGERWVVIWARDGVDAQPLAVTGEPERAAAVQINRPDCAPLLVFGTVLP